MENIRFSCSENGNTYISVNYHQKNGGKRVGKSQWSIEPNEEFELFCIADNATHRWISGGNLYSFRNNANDVIGKNNERFAKFDGDDSCHEWHGYPYHYPLIDSALVDYWCENGYISSSTKRKLKRRKI